jgi:hypothetical protein
VSAKIAAIRLDCLSKPVTAFGMSFQSFNSETAVLPSKLSGVLTRSVPRASELVQTGYSEIIPCTNHEFCTKAEGSISLGLRCAKYMCINGGSEHDPPSFSIASIARSACTAITGWTCRLIYSGHGVRCANGDASAAPGRGALSPFLPAGSRGRAGKATPRPGAAGVFSTNSARCRTDPPRRNPNLSQNLP